ncbi:MAG: serine/threonine protein kinase [Chloroflexi bacterium]|nr:MAG: serine/threonine protein kinase [Chloroflexota bacterium]
MPLDGLDIGRYHLLRLIGSGGMGEVYLAEDTRIKRQVAIKVIRGEAISSVNTHATPNAARLFEREAKAIARLNHSHILPLFDYGEESVNGISLTFMVMPYCPAGSLDGWLRQKGEARETHALSLQEAAYLLNQAADALQYAHDQQLVHQDVKPSNFLIRSTREAGLPDLLLTDFGIAKLITANSSSSQSVRGTPSYMAPEQWEGNPVIASDQYALGIMAYQLVTGRLPYQGGPGQIMYQHFTSEPQPPSAHMPFLSMEVDAVILQALAKKPEDRFDSITAFAQAFQQAAQDSNETINQLPSLKTSVPTFTSTDGRHGPGAGGSSDPYATVTSRPPEEQDLPLSVSDVSTVITGGKDGSGDRVTPAPEVNRQAMNEQFPMLNRGDWDTGSKGRQPKRQSGSGRGLLMVALALLALILIASGAGAYYFLAGSRSIFIFGGPDITATTRARGQSTAIALTTANARHFASATAQVKATSTAEANPYAPGGGRLVINDPLSNNSKGYNWEEGGRDGGADRAKTHLYYFIIDESGNFHLKVYFDKFDTSSVVASGSSAAIKTSGSNLIAVVARGGQIDLYVNRQLIKSLSDTTFRSGQIGVVALAGEVAFSNVRVWKL